MRLLLVAPEFPPAVGGMETHAWEIARLLQGRGHAVVVATRRDYAGENETMAGRIVPILTRRFMVSMWRLWRLMGRTRPDVVFVLNGGYAIAARILETPVVCRVVGTDVFDSWAGPSLPLRFLFWRLSKRDGSVLGGLWQRWDRKFRRACALWGLGAAKLVMPNSEHTARRLAESGIAVRRMQVVKGGVDLSLFRPRGEDETPQMGPIVLVTVGQVSHHKGIDTCLHALSRLVETVPTIEYRIIGEGPERHALEGLVESLGLAANVKFLGVLAPSDVASHLREARLYVQSSRRETMGRAVCEASASGVPAVVTRVGGLPDVVRDGESGLIVPPDDAQALAGAIERLVVDDGLHRQLAEGALRLARTAFGWETVVEETESALLGAARAGEEGRPSALVAGRVGLERGKARPVGVSHDRR